MGKLTYLTRHGTIETLSFQEVGAINGIRSQWHMPSWEKMNNLRVDSITKEEQEFIKKYGLKTTIFNIANLRKYGAIQIYPTDVKTALEHGAIDRR